MKYSEKKALLAIIKIHEGSLIDGDYYSAIDDVIHKLKVKKCLCNEGKKYAEEPVFVTRNVPRRGAKRGKR